MMVVYIILFIYLVTVILNCICDYIYSNRTHIFNPAYLVPLFNIAFLAEYIYRLYMGIDLRKASEIHFNEYFKRKSLE